MRFGALSALNAVKFAVKFSGRNVADIIARTFTFKQWYRLRDCVIHWIPQRDFVRALVRNLRTTFPALRP